MELYNFIYLPFGTGQVAYSWLIKAWECKRGESKSEAGLLLIICEVITMSRTYFLHGDEWILVCGTRTAAKLRLRKSTATFVSRNSVSVAVHNPQYRSPEKGVRKKKLWRYTFSLNSGQTNPVITCSRTCTKTTLWEVTEGVSYLECSPEPRRCPFQLLKRWDRKPESSRFVQEWTPEYGHCLEALKQRFHEPH